MGRHLFVSDQNSSLSQLANSVVSSGEFDTQPIRQLTGREFLEFDRNSKCLLEVFRGRRQRQLSSNGPVSDK
jgi:hypothetical protein